MLTKTLQGLEGIIPPLVTPVSDCDQLDVAGLERIIEHVIAGGVSGLFILGTTGEAPSLNNRLRRELITHTCQQVKGRLPVLVGITDTSLAEALALAAACSRSGRPSTCDFCTLLFPDQPVRITTLCGTIASRFAAAALPL